MLEDDSRDLVRTPGSHRELRNADRLETVAVAGKPGLAIPIGTVNGILEWIRAA